MADLTPEGFDLQSIQLTPTALEMADCVVIVTNHRDFDYQCIADYALVVVDTRNALRDVTSKGRVVSL